MYSLSRGEINKLKELGYQLQGDNWYKTPSEAHIAMGLKTIKIFNSDTLVSILVPEYAFGKSGGRNSTH